MTGSGPREDIPTEEVALRIVEDHFSTQELKSSQSKHLNLENKRAKYSSSLRGDRPELETRHLATRDF